MPLDEFGLIERFFSRPGSAPGVEIGIGDDAALIDTDGRLAVAVDTLVEGVHFPADLPAAAIGHRALAVNISDIAAMGLSAGWFTLALTLPAVDEDWLDGFASGLFALADRHGLALVGGDTTRGPLTVTIQVLADAGADPVLSRRSARPGDLVVVSGTLGDAAAVVKRSFAPDLPSALVERFRFPAPRVETGCALRGLASAAIDLSDGLLADLGHICEGSGCGAEIDAGSLPLSAELQAEFSIDDARTLALVGGDDYELCFTVPAERSGRLAAIAEETGVSLTAVGRCTSSGRIDVTADGRPWTPRATGFRHF